MATDVRVTIEAPTPLDGYVAVPARTADDPVPGVVVLHEAFGLTPFGHLPEALRGACPIVGGRDG